MNDEDLRYPYTKYVTWALAAAVIILSWVVFLVFLSSAAEARPMKRHKHKAHVVKVVPMPPVRTVQVRAVSTFDSEQEAVPHLINWPSVPTVTEQHIEKARKLLHEAIERRAQTVIMWEKKAEDDRNWEDFKKGLALACLSLGAMITVVAWPQRSSKRNPI